MKYLRKFNESVQDTINDICLELSDLGFYSDRNGVNLGAVIIQPTYFSSNKMSYVGISKNIPFHFDEIKDCVYRLKNFVGIDKIGTFNYELVGNDEYTICDMNKLQNETLNIDMICGAFMTFNFPVNKINI